MSFFNSCGSAGNQGDIGIQRTSGDSTSESSAKKTHSLCDQVGFGYKEVLSVYKTYLDNLPDESLKSIALAWDFINNCVDIDNPSGDSIYLLFNNKYYQVVNRINESFDQKYGNMVEQIDNNANSSELKEFKHNLAACGLDVYVSEGMHYLDAQPDYFLNKFSDRVSAGVFEFLKIRSHELKQGFSDDAAMLISFEELYQRVIRWERFINEYPNSILSQEANSFYKIYLEVLLTGMDNSRVFDLENNTINPEVKSLYERIKDDKKETRTKGIIAAYYSLLERHGFRENDSINEFLLTNNLSTMQGVQPHVR